MTAGERVDDQTENTRWQLQWHRADGQGLYVDSEVYDDIESAQLAADGYIETLVRESGADEDQAEVFRAGKVKICEVW